MAGNMRAFGIPQDVAARIDQDNGGQEVTILTYPYWSALRWSPTIAANVATFDTAERRAFGYAIGGNGTVAGFASTFAITGAETNLTQPGQTRDGADVYVWGISAHLEPNSDGRGAAEIWRNALVSLNLGGNTTIPLGKLAMFPQAGGLAGNLRSGLLLPDIATTGAGVDGGPGALFNYGTNGVPAAANYYKLPAPVKWSGVGIGADATFSISVTLQRAATIALVASRAAAAGVAGWTQPTTANAQPVDITFQLVCVSVGRRSRNV